MAPASWHGMLAVAAAMGCRRARAAEMFCEVTGPCQSNGPNHRLHLTVEGTAFGIGRNNFGQLGDGTRQHATAPVLASTQSPLSYVSAGGWHSAFLRRNGEACTAGRNNFGQLGDGTTLTHAGVRTALKNVKAVSAGGWHTLFLRNDGTAWAVGCNEDGQLGIGDYFSRNTPVKVLDEVKAISAGESHSLFVRTDGSVYATGNNNFGQLGDASLLMRPSPVEVLDVDDVESVIAGSYKSLFVRRDGTVWACGQADDSLGYHAGPDWPRSVPAQIATRIDDVAPGRSAALEQAHLGFPVFASDQRFPLDDPLYSQSLHELPGVGFEEWNPKPPLAAQNNGAGPGVSPAPR